MRRFFLGFMVLLLSACGDPHADYACDDGTSYSITLTSSKAIAVLEGEGVHSELMRVRTSTGLRYRGSSYELWIDGDQIVLKTAGVARNCRVK